MTPKLLHYYKLLQTISATKGNDKSEHATGNQYILVSFNIIS